MIIRDDQKNRAYWKTAIVYQLLPGRHGITSAVKLRPGKSYMERVVQHFCPLELRCDQKTTKKTYENELGVNAKEFQLQL